MDLPHAGNSLSGVEREGLLEVIEADHLLVQTLELDAALEVGQLHFFRRLGNSNTQQQ